MYSSNFITKPINLSLIPGFNELVNQTDNYERNILKLNKIEYLSANNQKYKVIRYDKNLLSVDLINSFGLCRSVIINSSNNVVCYSPPKSIPYSLFTSKYPNKTDSIIAQEFIEGTMINVFWDSNIGLSGAWEIATRNIVGATSSFYKKYPSVSFRDMFLEAANYCELELDRLNKNYCYSFVLQHPNNRIVVPFNKPQLYLVAIYSISNDNPENNIMVYSHPLDDVKIYFQNQYKLKFPQTIEWKNYSDLINKYASMNTPYDVLGVVIYNKETGERTKIRNPVYEQVRQLRGNQPKLQYQYLCLRNEGRVSEYLKYFPESKNDFSNYRQQIHLFTITLYNNYISCYIKKERPLMEFSEQFRTHMYNLHQKYLNELREKNYHISNTEVIKYVNNLHPSLLMYCLNYSMRKRNIDFIKADNDV